MVPATPYTIRSRAVAANNMIYVGFANFGRDKYHSLQTGFVYAYAPNKISVPVHSFQPAPQQGNCGGGVTWRGGDVWQAGRGLVADASGNVLVSTGNGYYDGVTNFGDTLLKLSANLAIKDWFTPANWQTLCQGDLDLGASGPILIPSLNYVVAGGKKASFTF